MIGLLLDADEVVVGIPIGAGMEVVLDPHPGIFAVDIQKGNGSRKSREKSQEQGNQETGAERGSRPHVSVLSGRVQSLPNRVRPIPAGI